MCLTKNQLPKILLISFFLTSCGGGGSNTDTPQNPQNPTQNNSDPFTAVTHVKSEMKTNGEIAIGASMYTQAMDNLGNITIVWNEVDHKYDAGKGDSLPTSPYRLMATTYSAKTKKWSAKKQINIDMPSDVKPDGGDPTIKMNNGYTFVSWTQKLFVKNNGSYRKAFVSRLNSHNKWTKPHYIRTGGSVSLAVNQKGGAVITWMTDFKNTIKGFLSPNKALINTITYQPVNAKWSHAISIQSKFNLPTYLTVGNRLMANSNSNDFYYIGCMTQPTDDYDINNWYEDNTQYDFFNHTTFIRKFNGTSWDEPDLVTPTMKKRGCNPPTGFDAEGRLFFNFGGDKEINKYQVLKKISNNKWVANILSLSYPDKSSNSLGGMQYNKRNELLSLSYKDILHRNKNGWQTPKKFNIQEKGIYNLSNAYLDDFGQIIVLLSRSSDSDPLNPTPQGLSGYPWPYIMLYTPSAGWSKPLRVPFERAAHAYPGIKNSPIHWPYITEVKLLANEHGDSVITWITQRDPGYNIIQSIVMPIENWNKLK